ncbi:MAG: AAA domain-containing protein [Candidatus Lokiarchaeota archaeon]|nr:AAA domain-containing protein [Candidatus Lokiarchaeota archaeon]
MVIDVNLPPDNPDQNFETFFKEYEDEPNHFKYREAIQDAAMVGDNTIYILFEDLLSFDPPLAEFLRNEPEIALRYAVDAFKELIRTYSGGSLPDMEYFVRVTTQNASNEVTLRGLRSVNIDKLIYVYGILIRASQIIPQITVATFQCPVCQTQIEIPQIETKTLIKPRRCTNPSCKNKKNFMVVSKDSEFIDWQSIKIQELPEELKPGRVPYSVKAILTHDLVDKARPGDRVKITGIYKIYPNETSRGKITTLFTPFIKVLSIEGRTDEDGGIEISEEDKREIRRWAQKKDIQETIAKSLAPGIYGKDHLKMAAAIALFGGVRKEHPNQSPLRGDIHVLFVGDPGTGKSQILKQSAKAVPQSVFTSGRGSSAAGLTAGIVKESDSGGMSLEAGALVLADGGIAIIDEFDKMNKKDRASIHEAMEQQTVSIAKAGIIATLRAQTSILAAANPQWGRYDEERSPTENINLPPTILSRFDLIFVVKDVPNHQEDEELAKFILHKHASESGEKLTADSQKSLIPFELLIKYIKFARTLKPKLTPEAIEEIKQFYIDIRSKNKNLRVDGGDVAVPIVARSLEGFVRLSEAYSKMALSSYVTREYAKKALKLAEISINDVSKDPITGQLNVDRIFAGVTTAKKKIFQMLDALKEKIKQSSTKAINEANFISDMELEMELDKSKIEKMLKNLHSEGLIYKPRVGFIALSDRNKDKKYKGKKR